MKIKHLLLFWGFLVVSLCGSLAHAESAYINLERIAIIESSGRADAYNARSKATGMYQITPICLADYNKVNNANYRLADAFNPQIGAKIAEWYLNERIPYLLGHFGLSDTLSNRLWAYNAGVGMVKRGIMPKETKDYIAKYARLS